MTADSDSWATLLSDMASTEPFSAPEAVLLSVMARDGHFVAGLRTRSVGETTVVVDFDPRVAAWARGRQRGFSLDDVHTVGANGMNEENFAGAAMSFMLELRLRLRANGPDDPDTLAAAMALALALYRLGEFKPARAYLAGIAEAFDRILGPGHPLTHSTRSALGEVLRESGQVDRALEVQEKAHEGLIREFGPRDDITLIAAVNLGKTRLAAGDPEGALALQQGVLDERASRLRPDAAETLQAKADVGRTLFEAGQLIRAEHLLAEVHAAQLATLGPENPATVDTAVNLGNARGALGDWEAAHRLIEPACARIKAALGDAHPKALTAANNLAWCLKNLGRLEPALQLQAAVVEASRSALGELHPDTLGRESNLALTLQSLGRIAESAELQGSIYERTLSVLGPSHPAALRAANNRAATLAALGELDAAYDLQKSTHELSEQAWGPAHPTTIVAAINLAQRAEERGDVALSRLIRDEQYAALAAANNPSDPQLLVVSNDLAMSMLARGDTVGARVLLESVCDVQTQRSGADHVATLTARNNLAQVLVKQGEYAVARRMQLETVQRLAAQLESTHPLMLSALANLVVPTSDPEELRSARQLQESIYAAHLQRLGEGHPATLTAMNNLALTLEALSEPVAAMELQARVFRGRQRVLGKMHPHTLTAALGVAMAEQARDPAKAARISVDVMEGLAESGTMTGEAFDCVARLPLLADPRLECDLALVGRLAAALPRISRFLVDHLTSLPVESWQGLQEPFEVFHRRWFAFAVTHSPRHLLEALSPLHGLRSWATAVSTKRADFAALPTSMKHYAESAAVLNRVRLGIAELDARIATLTTSLAGLRAQEERGADSHGVEAERQRLESELARFEARRLAQARLAERDAARVLEEAAARLRREAPEMDAALAALRGADNGAVSRSLREGDAWITFTANESNTIAALIIGATGNPAVIRLPALVEIEAAWLLFDQVCRSESRGTLRGSDDAAPAHLASRVDLAALRATIEAGFWSPLVHLLHGVRRIHLVTSVGLHGLPLEFAMPGALGDIAVCRFAGMPAYMRSIVATASSEQTPQSRVDCVVDSAEESNCPIPFTSLDSLWLRRRGQAVTVSAGELLADGPRDARLLVAAHGGTIGTSALQSGFIALPDGLRLDSTTPDAMTRPILEIYTLSCFGGRIGHTAQGDVHGLMGSLQLSGLRCGIACLMPISDFVAPLFSAVLWNALARPRATPGEALAEARRRLVDMPWDGAFLAEVIAPLRIAYREVMFEVLQRSMYTPGDPAPNQRALRWLAGLRGWSLSSGVRSMFFADDTSLEARHALMSETLCVDRHARESFVDECLDRLFKGPSRWNGADSQGDGHVMKAIDQLCASTVLYGAG